MRVRLGYVAIALNLPKVTSSSSVTYTNYKKIISDEKKLEKLKRVTLSNIEDLTKILNYNIKNNIHFYRITSKLVPLATHPDVDNWDYRKIFKQDFEILGNLIKDNKLRVDTHPDQFNVLNSVREDVVEATIKTLWFHVNFFKDIDYNDGKMVIHVGSSAGGKEASIKRFIKNFREMPIEIGSKLIIENDDKTFNTKEVFFLCKELNIPMVLDVHHHICNDGGHNLGELMRDILTTWNNESLPPKLHFSSPKNGEKDRKHSDYINAKDFLEFIKTVKKSNVDIDIMLEAKKKDLALFKLIEDIKLLNKNIKWIDNTTFEI